LSRSGELDRRIGVNDFDTLWTAHRRLVRDVAYRILGSFADAEDVTQDTYVKLLAQDLGELREPRAWLVTVASRLAVDRLRAHEHSRREYVGAWLPEPLIASGSPSPEDRVTLDDTVRMALMVTLERLSPAERTAFILHDVFDFDFAKIAEILGNTADASRQLASRARRHVREGGTRFDTDPAVARALAEGFARACAEGDLDGLIALLAPQVHGDFDSGGLIPGAPQDGLQGAVPVATQLLAGFAGQRLDYAAVEVNGEPGVVVRRGDRVVTVIAFEFGKDRIEAVLAVGNPAKLRHL
jgi:RNA polymerase sigma-70 factor (ECF subfamily)